MPASVLLMQMPSCPEPSFLLGSLGRHHSICPVPITAMLCPIASSCLEPLLLNSHLCSRPACPASLGFRWLVLVPLYEGPSSLLRSLDALPTAGHTDHGRMGRTERWVMQVTLSTSLWKLQSLLLMTVSSHGPWGWGSSPWECSPQQPSSSSRSSSKYVYPMEHLSHCLPSPLVSQIN